MKKKGFTLIELLGVIVLLGLIGLIVYPTVGRIIKDNKQKLYEKQISELKRIVYNYSITNDLGYEDNVEKTVTFEQLANNGYINNKNIKNPITGENLTGCMTYKWLDSINQYEINYNSECVVRNPEQIKLSINFNQANTPTDGWSNEDFYVNIDITGASSYKWCGTTNNSCEPKTLVNSNTGSALINTEGENNIICVIGYDQEGNYTEKVCSTPYKLDKTGPTFTGLTEIVVLQRGTVDLREGVSVSDSLSGTDGTFTVSPESIDTTNTGVQTVTYKAVDKVGNETTKTRTVRVEEKLPEQIELVTNIGSTTGANSNGWYKENINVNIDITGASSYKWCKTTNNTCEPDTLVNGNSGTVTIDTESESNIVCIIAYDQEGNYTEKVCSTPYKLDKTGPTFAGLTDKTVNKGETFNLKEGVTVSDALSEIDGTFTTNPSTLDTSKAGTQTITYTVTDKAGNETTETITITIDAPAPTFTFSPTTNANTNGWYKENITVNLNPTDNSGLGIVETKWCETAGSICTPTNVGTTGVITIESETSKVCAQSTDKNGKTSEIICSNAYKLDKTGPEFTGLTEITAARNEIVNLTSGVTASDALSDLNGTFTVSPTSVNTSKVGSQTVTYTVTDKAGNTTTETRAVTVTGQAPSITFTPTTSANKNGWYKNNFEVEINVVDDSGLGITSTKWCETTSSCTPTTSGTIATVTLESSNVKVCATATDGSGKTTTECSNAYKLDKTLPYFTGISDTTIQKGTAFDVKEGVTAADALSDLSGEYTVTPTSVDTSKAGTTTLTYSVTDKAGNTKELTRTIKVDAETPIITFTPATEPNENGWHKDNFFVTVNVEDQSGLGITSTSWCGTLDDTCTPNTSGTNAQVSLEGASTRICATATDNNGKSTTTCSDAYKLDTTAPEFIGIEDTTIQKGDTFNVRTGITAEDTTSGIDGDYSVTPTSVDTSKAGTTTLTYSVTDLAGNTTTETRTVKVDAPIPTLTLKETTSANSNGWYKSNIKVNITPTDNSGLGIVETKWCETEGSTCTPNTSGTEATVTLESANVKICAITTDNNGKSSAVTCSSTYKLDKTAPEFTGISDTEISRTSSINLRTGITASDSLSDLSGSYTVSPESIDTTKVGSTTVTYTATDKAGNTTTETRTVTVTGQAPTITFRPTTSANANGWYKDNISVEINVVDDSGYGISSTKWCETTSSCTPTTNGAIATVTLESASAKVCATATDGSGKSTTTCSDSYKLDKTLPYFTGISDTTIQKGSTFDVRNGVTASDALSDLSGAYTVTPTSVDTSKAGTTTLTYSVTDKAGNTNSVTRKVVVDAEAPIITFTPAIEPNSNGWYKSNFFVTVNVEDQSGLGIDSTKWCGTLDDTCTPNTSGTNAQVSLEGATTRVCAQSTDKNGKTSEVYCSDSYKLDKTAPEFTGISNTEINRTGSINLRTGITAEDKMSGISNDYTVSPTTIDTSKVGSTTVTYSVTDDAGNTTTTTRTITVIGQAPVITFNPTTSANSNGWYKNNFNVSVVTTDDSGYGISSTKWCETTESSCTPGTSGTTATVTLESENVKVCATATDGSGKSTTTCSSTYKLDKTLPYFTGISDITIQKGISFSATSGITADDALSKVDGTYSVSPTSVDTSKAGTTTLTYSVTDKAGNTNSVTRKVVVDADAPSITFTPTTSPNSNGWYKSNFYVTVNVTDNSGLGIKETKWCGTTSDTCTTNTSGTEAQVSLEGATTRVCAQSTDNNGKTSEVYCSDAYKLDKTVPSKPSITGGGTSYVTSASISLSAASTDTTSGGITYEYYVTSSSTAPTASTTATGTYTSPMTFNTNRAGDYIYVRAKDQAGNIGEWSSAQRLYIDINDPTISAKGSSYTITEGDSNVISSTYFNIDKNGNAEISSTTCTSNIDGTVSNTSSLSVGTHTIACTVTKTTNKTANASTTIIVESVGINVGGQQIPLVTTGDGLYLDNDGVYRYKGAAPANYIRLDSELYRILAIEDKGIKVIRSADVTSNFWSFGDSIWESSTAKTYLYDTYYSNLSSVNSYIVENATWNIGAVSNSSPKLLSTVKSEEKGTTWTGKIGLMTFSEYIQAQSTSSSGYSSCSSNVYSNTNCGTDNWLNMGSDTFTISADSTGSQVWFVSSSGEVKQSSTFDYYGLRPSLYLKPSIGLQGSGTETDPYVLLTNTIIYAKKDTYTVEKGASNDILSTYFNIFESDNEPISSRTCISDKDGAVTNTSSLTKGNHTVTCTVTTNNKTIDASTSINVVITVGSTIVDIGGQQVSVVTTGDGLYFDSDGEGIYRYKGANPKNYIILGSETYRIIAIEDQGIKAVRSADVTTGPWNDSGISIWEGSTIQTYLYNTYYSNLSSVNSYIVENATWNIGAVSNSSLKLLSTVKSEEKRATWVGKIGLMTVSEYVKAQSPSSSGYSSCSADVLQNSNCGPDNWLNLGIVTWTMNANINNIYAFVVDDSGRLWTGNAEYGDYGIRPVVVLKSTIKLSGTGAPGDPYKIIG